MDRSAAVRSRLEMRRSKFSEEEIRSIVEQVDAGARPAELAESYGVSVPTIYRWRSRFSTSSGSEARRVRQLEEENRRLRKIVAEQALDLDAVKSLLRKRR